MRDEDYRDADGYRRFMNEWDFSFDLMEYVERVYGESRWWIRTCREIAPGRYVAQFSPYYGYGREDKSLYIRIVRNDNTEIGWDFFHGL